MNNYLSTYPYVWLGSVNSDVTALEDAMTLFRIITTMVLTRFVNQNLPNDQSRQGEQA